MQGPAKVFGNVESLEPRVHGNGFIQLDLCGGRYRAHVWGHPDIPRQKAPTPIHDHVFSFRSTVLVGRLVNLVYDAVQHDEGAYELWQAQPSGEGSEDSKLAPAPEHDRAHGRCYHMRLRKADVVLAGDSYSMRRFDFHETFVPGLTMTLMEKLGSTLAEKPGGPRPYVAVPAGTEPDNDFDRHSFSRGRLMDVVREAMALWTD